MYTVTRTLPNGTTKISTADTIKQAGQLVAWCLHDNTDMTKRDATRHGMEAERTGHTAANGYTFTIEKGG